MRAANGKLDVLVIGSLPPPIGGCSVTLRYLIDELRVRNDVEVRVLDTSGIRGNGLRGAVRFASAVAALARLVRTVDLVTLHVATTAMPSWGFIVRLMTRLSRRPMILRKFAGTDYLALGPLRGRLAHHVATASDVYLVETRDHLEAARRRGIRKAYWFPTTRPMSGARADADGAPRERCRRFVYVGHVCRIKGVVELVEAMRQMPADVTLDVYGPRFDDLPADLFDACSGIAYRGALAPGEVVTTLSKYDALVFPSLARTEGYPGAILESYLAGLPVVASRIGSIPEIVDDSVGLLVEPGDVDQLRAAMRRLVSDSALYRTLQASARSRASAFSSERWSETFIQHCREAVGDRSWSAAIPSPGREPYTGTPQRGSSRRRSRRRAPT